MGPLSEYQAGGGIETFNQYSQGALFLASNLSDSAWFSVYIFQIIIYFLVITSLIVLGINKKNSTRVFISSLIFLLMFSDPASVGPQAYPSSGLLRFFPLMTWSSYILFNPKDLNIKFIKNRFKRIINNLLFIAAICVSFLWSGEMAICSLAAIFITILYLFIYRFVRKIIFTNDFKNFNYRYLIIFLIFFLSVIFLINSTSIENNFLDQLITYPLSYLNKRYGWYQPQAWITLSPLFALISFCSLVLLSNLEIIKKIGFMACCGLVFGYIAYRPVSNNITASLPSTLILISSFFGGNYFISNKENKFDAIDFGNLGKDLKKIVIVIAGTSAFLQLTNFSNVKKIVSISLGLENGEFREENGGLKVVDNADCLNGDKLLSEFINDKALINELRNGQTGLTFVGSKFNYLYQLGNCHEFNNKIYHLLFFSLHNFMMPQLIRQRANLL